jgi:hypothetical protein
MEGSKENQGPEECEAPHVMGVVEVVCDAWLCFVRPVERREGGNSIVYRSRVLNASTVCN